MFTDDIKNGLQNLFDADTTFSDKVYVNEGYIYNKNRKAHEVTITLIDDYTDESHNTFFGETVRFMPIQITVYSTQMKINGEIKSAKDSTNYLAEKVRVFMNREQLRNSEIKTCLRINSSTTLPLDDSGADTYFKAMRYKISAQPF